MENPLRDVKERRFTLGWLVLAVSSLVFAGIFAFLVAMARTPGVKDLLPGKEYFYIALVTHVDLAVVIWFLAFMGILWVLTVRPRYSTLTGSGLLISFAGTGLVIISGLLGLGRPVLSNYIPVLTHPIFYAGLGLFAIGILISVIAFLASSSRENTLSVPAYGMLLAGIMIIIAFTCFGLAYIQLSGTTVDPNFFERLFWGGGHILQFANTTGMIVAWTMLLTVTFGRGLPFSDRLAKVFLSVLLIFALPAPLIYFLYDIDGRAYKDAFTFLMQTGIGPSAGIFMIAIFYALWEERGRIDPYEPGFSSLLLSLILFVTGSLIAFQIQGSNVKIPSHYHGVIGAVTIAFMGLTYYILPSLGKETFSPRASRLQPYLYGIGQMLFVVGMFWAGREGVPRKTFGSAEVLTTYSQYVGMAVMGIGGLIAIIGGAFYVVNILLSLMGKGTEKEVLLLSEGKKA